MLPCSRDGAIITMSADLICARRVSVGGGTKNERVLEEDRRVVTVELFELFFFLSCHDGSCKALW